MTNKNKDKKTEDSKITELEANWKRALADYQNLQKRTIEEKEAIVKYSNSSLILRVLPVLDNLELMAKHNKDEGLKMTIGEFQKVLFEEGLEEILVEKKKFDVEKMDAVELVDGEPDKVVEVIQKGYMYKSKILRPARVKVGQKKEDK
ncbi:nucleotide exchange factor GrpE [candidate division WWE3 bacterium]|jgi:molecular chaperone GrpE|nr:nucleotide exchange factor GrpE [candidate division WWE3 bacterium]MBT7350366.1 nucleotide exchange factor GrpE [candidate division WWE3 bacterium]